jgi:hypothetical protein
MYRLPFCIGGIHCSKNNLLLADVPIRVERIQTVGAYLVQKLEENTVHFRTVFLGDLIAVTAGAVAVSTYTRAKVVRRGAIYKRPARERTWERVVSFPNATIPRTITRMTR